MALVDLFNTLAALLLLIGLARYALTIRKFRNKPFGTTGKPEPPKVTWLIWASLDTITLAGMFVKGTLTGQIIAAMGAWYLVYLGFRYGTNKYTGVDIFCAMGALLAVLLWQLFGDATWGIVTSNSVIFLGSLSAFHHAWKNPEQEDGPAWLIFLASCIVQMGAVWIEGDWAPEKSAQPVSFLLVEVIMVFILYVKPIMFKRPVAI